ncbi:MAG: hypothetical protein K9J06_13640 [Flavobacteriales bacterium]|nr:hypothetical protein [Flavobacteriales bacterium]
MFFDHQLCMLAMRLKNTVALKVVITGLCYRGVGLFSIRNTLISVGDQTIAMCRKAQSAPIEQWRVIVSHDVKLVLQITENKFISRLLESGQTHQIQHQNNAIEGISTHKDQPCEANPEVKQGIRNRTDLVAFFDAMVRRSGFSGLKASPQAESDSILSQRTMNGQAHDQKQQPLSDLIRHLEEYPSYFK